MHGALQVTRGALSIALVTLADLSDQAWNDVFQTVLGMVMTVLIALEFNHSIISVLERHHGAVRLGRL